MSKIYATDHFETQNWEVTFEDLAPNYADLFIGFTDEAPVVEFKDLKFKYELRQGDNIKQHGVYPPPGVYYERTDQEYLVAKRLKLEAEEEYTLYLWAKNGKVSFEKTVNFTTPRPVQPYYSWAWVKKTKQWVPPVPYPDDSKLYKWDENNQTWAENKQ